MKIAMVSSWHVHAKGYGKEFKEMPGCEIVAVWDENPAAGREWAEELGCAFVENYDDLLADANIDGVVISSPTSMHPDLMVKAANAGKHIFTEKVLAIKLEDALKIKEAVVANGVKFAISFPHRCRADILLAKQMQDSGALGELTYARVRNVHNGSIANWLPPHFYNKEQCGGGAMIDLGAHSIYLMEWFLGKPTRVVSAFTNYTPRDVEDNAVTVLSYANGAIGVAETGFVSVHTPFVLELGGTKGSLTVRNGVTYATEETGGKWVEASGSEYPAALPNALQQWVSAFNDGTEILFDLDLAVSLTEVMAMAYKGAK